MDGIEIREKRNRIGLSQSKLSFLTGIKQARLSAYELGKMILSSSEVIQIEKHLKSIDEKSVQTIKKKRIQKKIETYSAISQRPRKSYEKTQRNSEYLEKLRLLEYSFHNPQKSGLKAMSFFAGCGGLCYGVKTAGFEIVATNELVENYKEIYKLNFEGAKFLTNNVQEIRKEEINKIIKKYKTTQELKLINGFQNLNSKINLIVNA